LPSLAVLMQPEEEQLKKLSRRYFLWAVISLFLMALLRGLSSFFFTLFFWPAIGLIIIGFYYQRAAKKEEQAKTAQWHQPDPPDVKNKRIILMVIASAVFLLVIISSLFSSNKSDDSSNEAIKTEEPESQPEETNSSEYDKALLEYNKQNYKSSISVARKALVSDPNNNDLMSLLGEDYGALKQKDSSFVWFDRAYQNGARNAELSHWLGYLYDDKGSTSQGIQFYKDALKQDSTRTQIYDRLAELEPDKADWYKKKSSQWAQKN
jgi:tetratricopeptide (TPR) repeat protein